MNARISKDWSQNSVLNVIQTELVARHAQDFGLPGPAGADALLDDAEQILADRNVPN